MDFQSEEPNVLHWKQLVLWWYDFTLFHCRHNCNHLHPLPSGSPSLLPFMASEFFLSLPFILFTSPMPLNHGIFSSLWASRTTQKWRTLCKNLPNKEGSQSIMSPVMQTGMAMSESTPRCACSLPRGIGCSQTQGQTTVCHRAKAWNLTCHPLPGPRVPGGDLTRTTIMR